MGLLYLNQSYTYRSTQSDSVHHKLLKYSNKLQTEVDQYAAHLGISKLNNDDRRLFYQSINKLNPKKIRNTEQRRKLINIKKTIRAFHSFQPKEAKPDKSLFTTVDELNEKGGMGTWAASSILGNFSHPTALNVANGCGLASSLFGMLKAFKDTFSYCYHKVKIWKIHKSIKTNIRNLSSVTNKTAKMNLNLQLREQRQKLQKYQGKIDKVKQNYISDTYLSTTYFAGAIAAVVSTTALATIVSAAVGSVAYGAGLVISVGFSLKEQWNKRRIIEAAEAKFKALEEKAPPGIDKNVVQLKRDFIQKTERKELWFDNIKSLFLGTAGITSMVLGILVILGKVSIAVAVGISLGTGIGAAVVVSVAAAIIIGYAIYKHYKARNSEYAKLVELRTDIIANLETKLNTAIKKKQPLQDILTTNRTLQEEKRSLDMLKARMNVKSQISNEAKNTYDIICGQILLSNKSQLEEIAKSLNQHAICHIPDAHADDSLEERQTQMIITLSQWITQRL